MKTDSNGDQERRLQHFSPFSPLPPVQSDQRIRSVPNLSEPFCTFPNLKTVSRVNPQSSIRRSTLVKAQSMLESNQKTGPVKPGQTWSNQKISFRLSSAFSESGFPFQSAIRNRKLHHFCTIFSPIFAPCRRALID